MPPRTWRKLTSTPPSARAGLLILGLITAVVFIAFAINLALGGQEFLGRLGNVFMPFGLIKGNITRTQLALVEPKDGNVTVSVGKAVSFAVNVTGYVPKTNRPDPSDSATAITRRIPMRRCRWSARARAARSG